MDADSTRVQDELRRSKREEQSPVRQGEQAWQYGLMLPGVSPLAGALADGRGNSPVRAAAMRGAQTTYGNTSVQRYLRSRPSTSQPTPVQRVLIGGEVSDALKKLGVTAAYAEQPASDAPSIAPSIAPAASAYAEQGETFGSDVGPEPVAASGGGNYAYTTGASFDKPTSSTAPSIASPAAPSIAPAIAPSAAPSIAAGQTPGYRTKSLLAAYEYEDMEAHGYETAENVSIKTRYMEKEEERTPYKVSVGEGGRLFQGGHLLETDAGSARTGIRAAGSAGGHLYAMSPQGQIYSADMASEWEKGGMQGPDATVRKVKRSDESIYVPKDRSAESAEATTFHHSSFLAGGDVAGAGEMKVHEGILSMISNASGHYMPGPEYVMQTLNQLEAGGSTTDQARVRLMGDLTEQGYDASKEVTAAVGEFKSAGGSRDELLKRHDVAAELRQVFGVRQTQGGPSEPSKRISQLLSKPEVREIKDDRERAIMAADLTTFSHMDEVREKYAGSMETKREEVAKRERAREEKEKREARRKEKGAFSFGAAEVSAASSVPSSTPAPSIAPSRQGYKAYGAQDEEESVPAPAPTSAPSIAPTPSSPQLITTPAAPPQTAYTAYRAQDEEESVSESAPMESVYISAPPDVQSAAPSIAPAPTAIGSAYISAPDEEAAAGLPPGYIQQPEDTSL